MRLQQLFTLFVLAALSAPGICGEPRFTSGERQAGLIELYTSEGCSSCPPADRWLTGLRDSPGLWRDFVPVAFHVDYWDDLGWKDRFAAPANSARQRLYADEGGLGTVYTPAVIYNGAEWRNWEGADSADMPAGIAGGVLRAELVGSDVLVTFWPHRPLAGPVTVSVALLGSGLISPVKAGENRGRQLRHDFVVLATSGGALRRGSSGYSGTVPMPVSDIRPPQRAVAVWVAAGTGLRPLQATGGWLGADVPPES